MLGFMFPTWFLSMWISNTAATAMMLPMVEAVLEQVKPDRGRTAAGVQEVTEVTEVTDGVGNGGLTQLECYPCRLCFRRP